MFVSRSLRSSCPWSLAGRPFFTTTRIPRLSRSQSHQITLKHHEASTAPKSAMVQTPFEDKLTALLENRRKESKLRSLKSSPPDAVDFSSNDFLSLSTNPDFRQDYLAALNSDNTSLGSTGSRLLDGNSKYAEALEKDLAAFHGAEAGLLVNSGFDANVSIFTCLPQPEDVIVYDELIHASVHDGMRQSRAAARLPFKHNDVESLHLVLQAVKSKHPSADVFIAVESVYSMEGDVAPLSQIADTIDAVYPGRKGHLIVDEAHATGVYGSRGAGVVFEQGLEDRVSVRLHTFGKALACNGAVILCSPIIRLYLLNYARPLIYTTFMSHPSLVAIRTAYKWLEDGRADQLAQDLRSLITHLYGRLQSLRSLTDALPHAGILSLPPECPNSPIFALLSTKPRELASYCQEAGFLVRPVVPPTVPEGAERVRVCLHTGNTTEQIDRFVERVANWANLQAVQHMSDCTEVPQPSCEESERLASAKSDNLNPKPLKSKV
jgi:8-amino-7-oxononanoate synthase